MAYRSASSESGVKPIGQRMRRKLMRWLLCIEYCAAPEIGALLSLLPSATSVPSRNGWNLRRDSFRLRNMTSQAANNFALKPRRGDRASGGVREWGSGERRRGGDREKAKRSNKASSSLPLSLSPPR